MSLISNKSAHLLVKSHGLLLAFCCLLPVFLATGELIRVSSEPSPVLSGARVAEETSFPPRSVQTPDTNYVYLINCSGEYLKLDAVGRQSITRGMLSDVIGAKQRSTSLVANGCFSSDLQYDSNAERLYAVLSKTPKVAEDGGRRFQVAVYQLPELKVVGTIELTQPLVTAPAILLTPDGRNLLVSLQVQGSERDDSSVSKAIAVYDTKALKVLKTIREASAEGSNLAGAMISASFSEKAYYGPDGKTIYDNGSRTKITSDMIIKDIPNPLSLLPEQQRSKLRSYEEVDPITGKPWLRYNYVSSAKGKVVLGVTDRAEKKSAFWWVDLTESRTSPLIETSLAIAHLAPDGRMILFEEIEWREEQVSYNENEKRRSIYKTGSFMIIDALSGERVSEFRHKELAGFWSRLACITPDASSSIYSTRDGLYWVSLKAGENPIKVKSGFATDQWTQCIFTSR